MATQSQAIAYLNGAWRTSPYVRNIAAGGGYGIDVDGEDGFQCKDFANGLGRYLGVPLPTGNAIVLSQKLASGWSWVTDPQPGDLAVRNYFATVNGTRTNFGDVLGVTAVNGTTLTTIGQNQVSPSLTVGHVPTTDTHSKSEFIKFLRCNYVNVAQPQGDAMNQQQVINLYTAILHRAPENQAAISGDLGKSANDVIAGMLQSAEWLTQNDIFLVEYPKLQQQVADLQKQLADSQVTPPPAPGEAPTVVVNGQTYVPQQDTAATQQ